MPEVGVGPLPPKGRTRSSARSRLRGLAYAPPTARTPRPALVQSALAAPSRRAPSDQPWVLPAAHVGGWQAAQGTEWHR